MAVDLGFFASSDEVDRDTPLLANVAALAMVYEESSGLLGIPTRELLL